MPDIDIYERHRLECERLARLFHRGMIAIALLTLAGLVAVAFTR